MKHTGNSQCPLESHFSLKPAMLLFDSKSWLGELEAQGHG